MPTSLKTRSSGTTARREPGPPDRPRRRQRVAERKSAILDAALGLFSRYGLRGVTVDQIAEAADVSKTNLFYYFRSKDEVYVAVLKRLLDDWLAPLESLTVDAEPLQAIEDYVRLKMRMAQAEPRSSRLFCLEVMQGAPMIGEELRTSLKDLVDRKAAIIRTWADEGKIAPVDPHHLIYAIWAMTQHYADFATQVEAISGRGLDDPAFFDQATDNVLRLVIRSLAPDRA
ncbi:HTH-type transcriptional regulator RutR [Methylopila turkensis]|uniref:Pyrimidine utilization regulatory protein R n=1 Tax=Methylopila turkensis TaxID=1437816 RepID=A0A9W6JPD5_9HYPH|nr:HTH-type transcriptional regulator RutR [Methylopila turkensis]GLK80076.1 pyrimidine utilization regulatory protein R [Methylopila turkensis]